MAYFSNSTEGVYLDEQCDKCIHGLSSDAGCPVALAQIEFNYDQVHNKKLQGCLTILVDVTGQCQVKPWIDKLREQERQNAGVVFKTVNRAELKRGA